MDTYEFIIALSGVLLIGIPFSIFTFHTVKRLREISFNRMVKGDIFISDSGDIYSEFDIPATEIMKLDYILLKVTPIHMKEEKGNEGTEKS